MVKEYRIPEDMDVFNEVDDNMWIASYGPETSRFIWGNSAAIKLWGKNSLEEMISTDICTGRSEAVKKIHEGMYTSIQVKGEVLRERRTLYPNKIATVLDLVFKPIHARITGPDNQETTEIVVLVQAVPTKEKGAEEANRSHEMLRHSPVLSMLFSPEGGVLGVNLSAKTYYKCGGDDCTCLKLKDVLESCDFAPPQRDALLAQCMKLRPGERSITFECKKTQHNPDHGINGTWHMIQCIPTYDPSTGAPALLITESDISQLQQLKKAHEEQEAAMRQQEQFFAAVSHELRTPLNGIIGLSESLVSDEELEPSVSDTLRVIHASGIRLSRLVNDILDAAALKHSTMVLKMEKVCLDQVVETVVELTSTLAKPGVKLINAIDGELPPIHGDFDRLTQVLTNLVGNSLKFTLEGSVTVSGYVTAESVVLEVRDTGIGIPEDKLDDIFVAFEQVDMSSTRKFEGTGLGLAIVKSMVEAHGGTIGVSSSTGPDDHGSCFAVMLPLKLGRTASTLDGGDSSAQEILDLSIQAERPNASSPFAAIGTRGAALIKHVPPIQQLEEEKQRMQDRLVAVAAEIERLQAQVAEQKSEPESESESSGNNASASPVAADANNTFKLPEGMSRTSKAPVPEIVADGLQVLTIDDNPVNQMMIQNALRPLGYTVMCCKDGREALAFLRGRAQPPDIILLDLMMPGMSGLDVVTEIRALFSSIAVPVLMISAKSGDVYVEQGLRMGCNDYITKPFSARELVARIQAQLSVRKLLTIELEARSPAPRTTAQERCSSTESDTRAALEKGGVNVVERKEAGTGTGTGTGGGCGESGEEGNGKPERVQVQTITFASGAQTEEHEAGWIEGGPPLPFYSALHHGREILSIDDTHVNHMVLERIFTKEGFAFTSCCSGIAALDLILTRQFLPDCILLDVMMPEMSGIEVCARIRELYGKQVPVLLISAKSDEENILSGFRVGCDDYVTKPFKRKELVARVESRCSTRRRSTSALRPSSSSVTSSPAPPRAASAESVPRMPSAHKMNRSCSAEPAVEDVAKPHEQSKSETLVAVQLCTFRDDSAHLPARLQAAVETVKGVMAQHHLVVRSSLLAPLALMATVPADLLPKKQASTALAAALQMLQAVKGLPAPLQIRVGVLAVQDDGEKVEDGVEGQPLGVGASAAAGLLLNGCQAGCVIVGGSVAKLLEDEAEALKLCGSVPGVVGQSAETRHVYAGKGGAGKVAEEVRGLDRVPSDWMLLALQAKAAAEEAMAQQRQQQQGVWSSLGSTMSRASSVETAQAAGGLRESNGGLVIEDVPGDTDFIDRVSRCVLVEGLPSTSSATRRTIASVMGGFGVLQSQLELRPKMGGGCVTVAEFDSDRAVQAAARKLDGVVYNGARLRVSALLPGILQTI